MPLTALEEQALDRWRPPPPVPISPLATKELTVSDMALCLMLARHLNLADPLPILTKLAGAKDAINQFLLSRQQVPVDPMSR